MAVDLQRGLTVILEDAYKQNRVYRSWEDIQSGETTRNEAPLPLVKASSPAVTASTGSVGQGSTDAMPSPSTFQPA